MHSLIEGLVTHTHTHTHKMKYYSDLKKGGKATEANRRRGSRTREKVRLRRISLECNTYVHGRNTRNLPV
jgi:hypothetical protein